MTVFIAYVEILIRPFVSKMLTSHAFLLTLRDTIVIFTSWYDVSHAMGFRGWGEIQLKITHSLTHSLTLLDN